LKTVKTAVDLYLVRNNLTQNTLLSGGGSTCTIGNTTIPTWRISVPNTVTIGPLQGRGAQPFVNSGSLNGFQNPVQVANPRDVAGGGWIPVDFTQTTGSTPISKLPLDPVNVIPTVVAGNTPSSLTTPNVLWPNIAAAYFYAYQCTGLYYEINANMESIKYSSGGDKDVESKDGGLLGRSCIDNACNSAPSFSVTQAAADVIYEVGNDPGLDL
jgi:hypothetical protein